MLQYRHIPIVVALLIAAAGALRAQAGDTVHLRYRFAKGDQVTYRVYSVDSIVIYDTVWRTVLRERREMMTFRCDSVLPSGNGYIMTVTTTDYHDNEQRNGKAAEHTSHPWRGRPVTFVMGANGRRVGLINSEGKPGTAPGGPFAPLILPNLGPDTAVLRDPVNFTNDAWLVDNVAPPIKWHGQCFRVADRRFDTLGERALDVQLSEVATTNYHQTGAALATRATTNGSGNCYFSERRGYPLAGEYQMINRFTMQVAKDHSLDGVHTTGIMFELMGLPSAKSQTGHGGKGRGRSNRK